MINLFVKFIVTIGVIASLIGIKMLNLSAPITILLIAVLVFFCVYTLAGGFSKKKSVENPIIQ